MRTALLIVAVLGVTAARTEVGLAQAGASLDQVLTPRIQIMDPSTVPECGLGAVIDQIARAYGVATGFENLPHCGWWGRGTAMHQIDQKWLAGMTVRQVFDHVVTVSGGRFRWKQVNGVVTMRPVEAWDDPANVLNLPTDDFTVSDASMDDAVDSLTKVTKPPLFMQHQHVPHPRRDIDRLFSVSCPPATMLESLNEIVRAQGAALWELAYGKERSQLHVASLQPQLSGGVTLFVLAYSRPSR